jgi:hypothetical protein
VGSDPLQTVWVALDQAGCDPHGDGWKFRARCPAHSGENRESLSVGIGADGRALIYCHAHGCDLDRILSAIGLAAPDLFPAGHHKARRRTPLKGGASFMGQLRELLVMLDDGREFYAEVRTDCPHCGSPACLLQVTDHSIIVSCPGDQVSEGLGYTACTLGQYREALAAQYAGDDTDEIDHWTEEPADG